MYVYIYKYVCMYAYNGGPDPGGPGPRPRPQMGVPGAPGPWGAGGLLKSPDDGPGSPEIALRDRQNDP